MENLLEKIVKDNRSLTKEGKVATYIPELANGNGSALGICVITKDKEIFQAGDFETKFTIQSISKIVSLMYAIKYTGIDTVFKKVSAEPTAYGFNSIVNLEVKNYNKPLNPMINAGAIAVASMLKGTTSNEKFENVLNFIRQICNNNEIQLNEKVYLSEKRTGHRNRSLAHFMRSTNVIEGDVEEILDVYFKLCSIEVTCKDIASIAAMLALDGVLWHNDERIIESHIAKMVKAIMMTCGMYDASGEYAVKVGIPSKSGVGGGILATVPNKMGIGVVGPALDEKGNSIAGIEVLDQLSKELNLSIF
ncbi:glutaminase A [Anaeromicrobium sediminis]|uniref:Glutaminase n=1 Tax=Anaeromicrobium sediminis TaxID=1478221 RepID=A0A267MME6_9FIRM|nr:glutaminase A [Anaeromicrobium sediminis]PAB59920.1 glutaminase A [Anaeromicrobium sediminis]